MTITPALRQVVRPVVPVHGNMGKPRHWGIGGIGTRGHRGFAKTPQYPDNQIPGHRDIGQAGDRSNVWTPGTKIYFMLPYPGTDEPERILYPLGAPSLENWRKRLR